MQKTLWTLRYHWKTIVFWLAAVVALSVAALAQAATLEIPGPNSTQSGIQLISGWKCEATGPLTIRFDGGEAIPLLYGSKRGDTRKPDGPCDEANTGFIAVMNWGNLGDGEHTAVVYDNGVEFDRAIFTVVTTGVDFLRDVTGSGTATLSNGQQATLEWSDASQAFVATRFTPPPVSDGTVCTTKTARVLDEDDSPATWIVENPCDGRHLNIDITPLTLGGFVVCSNEILIDQGACDSVDDQRAGRCRVYESVFDFTLTDGSGSKQNIGDRCYSTLQAGDTLQIQLIVLPNSSLNLSQPFTMTYNTPGGETFEFP